MSLLKVKEYLHQRKNKQFEVLGRFGSNEVAFHALNWGSIKKEGSKDEFRTTLYNPKNPIRVVKRIMDNKSVFIGDTNEDGNLMIVEFFENLVHCTVLRDFIYTEEIKINEIKFTDSVFNEEYLHNMELPHDIINEVKKTSNYEEY